MRRACWFVFATATVAATGLVLRAQDQTTRSAVTELVRLARELPYEFAADTLIRLAGSPDIADNETRRDIVDEAFARAYSAQEPYRRTSSVGVPIDSRQGAQLFAYTTPLTRLSLQVRAAQLMLYVDAPHARELFEWIDLHLTPGVCEDPLVPIVDEYYSALGLFARTASQTNRADALRFLELHLFRAHLPTEMPAVVRAVRRFRPQPDEASYLEGVLRWILDKGSIDPRGFSSADLDIVTGMADLQKSDHDLGLIGSHLMQALREYLITQLKGPRCSDSTSEAMTPASFNAALERVDADAEVKPIVESQVRPSRMLGAARIDMYWQTPDARRLRTDALRLRGPDKDPLPEKVRRTREWLELAERLLVDVEQWTGTSEAAERDYFFQKSALLGGLLELTPPSTVRTHALRAFVEFLRQSDIDRDRRALWFAFLNRLLEMAYGERRREILTALEDSHHPILSLYARMERLGRTRSRS